MSRLMVRNKASEKKLRNAVERDPKLGTAAGKVWDEVAAAYKDLDAVREAVPGA